MAMGHEQALLGPEIPDEELYNLGQGETVIYTRSLPTTLHKIAGRDGSFDEKLDSDPDYKRLHSQALIEAKTISMGHPISGPSNSFGQLIGRFTDTRVVKARDRISGSSVNGWALIGTPKPQQKFTGEPQ
jgi:hypothetical protein